MKDDAVAPVIAVMLILAVAVTFFAAWNAYYVPSMKAQSEINHIKDVESGFLKFSSDIENAVSHNLKNNMRLSETIPLGGGDFTFDPVKSGGELKVWNASPDGYFRMNWTNRTGPDPASSSQSSADHNSSLVKFSYTPVNNFWQEQGYVWTYGNVYVNNTERNLVTPLDATTMANVTYDGLARSLVELEPKAYSSSGDCSVIIIHVINITPDPQHAKMSGNGNGMLVLESSVDPERIANVTSINLSITAPPGRFNSTFWEYLNTTVNNTVSSCGNVYRNYPPEPTQREIQLTFNPNVTLIRETTEITIGAY
ncbi:hypothetical protein [Methanoregula sp.]|uniref:hypothetical protein n=1 Tax=Methanoregula sp. TaxID=2052170 RepID=UPI00236B8058|nr:hypothetical protein [Methanoregula sp.]MDD1687328.1 hypothetical protein [Methanoregula sp.]